MTQQEYLKRNSLGFEGDIKLQEQISNLIKQKQIETVIETGTYRGYTTVKLAGMTQLVYTFENNHQYYTEAAKHLKDYHNIKGYFGDSVAGLKKVLPNLSKDKQCLFFLDAHWGNVCPLLDELQVIADNKLKPVIVIHDFFNPEHPDYGYDSYNGKRFDLDFIKDKLDLIYGVDNYAVQYNSEAEGAKRGVIFIQPIEVGTVTGQPEELKNIIEYKGIKLKQFPKPKGRPKGSKNVKKKQD